MLISSQIEGFLGTIATLHRGGRMAPIRGQRLITTPRIGLGLLRRHCSLRSMTFLTRFIQMGEYIIFLIIPGRAIFTTVQIWYSTSVTSPTGQTSGMRLLVSYICIITCKSAVRSVFNQPVQHLCCQYPNPGQGTALSPAFPQGLPVGQPAQPTLITIRL
jgi:hypothetical protein